jgi:hypothetical protein
MPLRPALVWVAPDKLVILLPLISTHNLEHAMGSKTIYASQQAPGYQGLYIAKLEVDISTTLWFFRSSVGAKIESTLFGPKGLKKKKVEQLGLHITLIGQLKKGNGGWTSTLHNLVVGNHLSQAQVGLPPVLLTP